MKSGFVPYARLCLLPVVCLVAIYVPSVGQAPVQPSGQSLELTRTIRSWEFLPLVGTRAGLFGNETGRFEAWVYPLKIFREFHLVFHVGDRALPAESLARTLTVRPESASVLYVGDSFRVRESLCVPVNEPGAVILLHDGNIPADKVETTVKSLLETLRQKGYEVVRLDELLK